MSFNFDGGASPTLLSGGGGSVTINADGSITATPASGKDITLNGRVVMPQTSAQTLAAATQISPNGITVAISANSPITLSATPTIATGDDGQELTLQNVGTNAITLQANALLSGSALRLTTGTLLILAQWGSLRLRYIAALGQWVQIGGAVVVV